MKRLSRSSIWKLLVSKESPPSVIGDKKATNGILLQKTDSSDAKTSESKPISIGDVVDHNGQRAVLVSAPRIMPGDPSCNGREVQLKIGIPRISSLVTGDLDIVEIAGTCKGFDDKDNLLVEIV